MGNGTTKLATDRGRMPLPCEERRRNKVVVALRDDELRALEGAAAVARQRVAVFIRESAIRAANRRAGRAR